MPCCFAQVVRAFFLILLLALPVMGQAAEPAADKAEAEKLIQTLQNPEARDKLILQLKMLEAADKAAETEEPGLLDMLAEKIGQTSDELLLVVSDMGDAGHLADWLRHQLAEPELRAAWGQALWHFAVLFGAGVLAERLLRLVFAPLRRLLEGQEHARRWQRLPGVLGYWLLEALPVGLFFFVSHGLRSLPALVLSGDAKAESLLVCFAYAVTRLILVTVQSLLLPAAPNLRLPVLDDETSAYLSIWSSRLTMTGVWGYFLLQACKLLGMPKNAYGFSLRSLGLVITTLLIILILQNRQSVAVWLRHWDREDGAGRMQALRERLADVWHLLACLYIAGCYFIWALQVKGGFEYVLQASALTVLVLAAGNLAVGLLGRLVLRAFSISDELRQRLPHLEARVNRYLAVMDNVVRGVVGLAVALIILQIWGVNVLSWLSSDLGRRLISSALSIAAVLAGAMVVWELLNASIERYLGKTDEDGHVIERSARARTLLPLLRNAVMILLSVMVGLIVLSELGVNIAPLLAGAGVVGVAIGFGSQKLVQDVITGAFILFEDTIAVGDTVKIGEHTGTVEAMTIRTLKLRDATGQVHTLPFSAVSSVVNQSRDFAYYLFDLGVSYQADVDQVMETIRTVGEEMRGEEAWSPIVTDAIEVMGLHKFDASSVVIRGRLKTIPNKQWAAGREFNRRIKLAFDAKGIEIPYPTQTVYYASPKDGAPS